MNRDIKTRRGIFGLLTLGGVLLAGCQTAPPVREHTVETPTPLAQVGGSFEARTLELATERPPVAEYDPTKQTGVSYNSPTVGAPLYYQPDNLNWEQAPPFGRW